MKESGKDAVKSGKGFTLFILNENVNDIVWIEKALQDSNVLLEQQNIK